jgi:hypothetical protein
MPFTATKTAKAKRDRRITECHDPCKKQLYITTLPEIPPQNANAHQTHLLEHDPKHSRRIPEQDTPRKTILQARQTFLKPKAQKKGLNSRPNPTNKRIDANNIHLPEKRSRKTNDKQAPQSYWGNPENSLPQIPRCNNQRWTKQTS